MFAKTGSIGEHNNSINLVIYLVVEREIFYEFCCYFIVFKNSFYDNDSKRVFAGKR